MSFFILFNLNICYNSAKNEVGSMVKYDFHQLLEPYEFQYLVRDILQIKEKCFFESFSPGKDGGIDLRKTIYNNSVIVQIKRYENNFKKLLYSLKKYELPKVEEFKPMRYIIVTSVDLGIGEKEQIFQLFKGYIKNTEDILGQSDLNNLLGSSKYFEVELNYPNLWFNSGNTFLNKLDNIVNNAIYEESRAEYENIKNMMKYFVPVDNFGSIINNLQKNRYLLITGNPGIGKTSLARAIMAYFVQKKDYQFIYIHNVDSANKVYYPNKKQIFFFDDFWGHKFKETNYSYTEEKKLKEFIEKIEKSKNKILVLTSRNYVLEQGLISNIDVEEILIKQKVILQLKDYSLKFRVDILLKLLYTSNLNFYYIKYIIDNIDKVLYHKNFNPRVIETYLNNGFDLEVKDFEYYNSLLEDLDCPFNFLEKIYIKQSKAAQVILYLILFFNGEILLKDLRKLYLNVFKLAKEKGINLEEYEINNILEQLENVFLKTKYNKKLGVRIAFLNYSIMDFLYEYMYTLESWGFIITDALMYFNQFVFLLSIHVSNLEDLGVTKKSIEDNIINNFDDYNMVRSHLGEDLPFEEMSEEEQTLFKLSKLLEIENLSLKLKNFICLKFEDVLEALRKKDRKYIFKDWLSMLINIVEKISKFKIYDGKEIIQIYYDNCMYASELYYINNFENIFPEEYKEFINNDDFELLLKTLVSKDLEYFKEQKDYSSLEELLILLDTDLNYLNIEKEQYEKVLNYDEVHSFYLEDDIDDYEDNLKKDINDIKEYCYNFFQLEEGLKNREIEQIIKDRLEENEAQKLTRYLSDNTSYLKAFRYNKESLDILIDYYQNVGFFQDKATDFCYILIKIILENEDIDGKYFMDLVLIALETFYKNQSVFTMDTFKNRIFDFNMRDKNVKKLLNSDIFVKHSKYYSFINPLIHSYLITLGIHLMEEKQKGELLSEVIFALGPLNSITYTFMDYFEDLCRCLIELDEENFKIYFLENYLEEFIESIKTESENSIILSMLDYFHIIIYLDSLDYGDLKNYECSLIHYELWNILRLILGNLDLCDYITDEAFLEFKELFRDNIKFKFKNNYYRIDLDKIILEDTFYKWLKKYKLTDVLLSFYKDMLKLSEICKTCSFDSFKDYKMAIKNEIEKEKVGS